MSFELWLVVTEEMPDAPPPRIGLAMRLLKTMFDRVLKSYLP